MTEKISLVLTRYNETDLEVIDILDDVYKNHRKIIKIVFYDQKNSLKIKKYVQKIGGIYKKIKKIPLGEIRALGLHESQTKIVAFTDIDVKISPTWSRELLKSFKEYPNTAIHGGNIYLILEKPNFCANHSAFIRSLYGEFVLSNKVSSTETVHGGNMVINKKILRNKITFNKKLGRQKGKLIGGEETELCSRCIKEGYTIIFNPNLIVYHKIPRKKLKLKWILKSLFSLGYTRALRGGKISKNQNLENNLLDYLILTLSIPVYLIGYISGKLKKC